MVFEIVTDRRRTAAGKKDSPPHSFSVCAPAYPMLMSGVLSL